jgi:hypothetical protein
LASLKGQTRPANEVVVVCRADDSETEAVLRQLTRLRLPIICAHPTGPGVVAAYNAGIEVASGAIIAFIDDDAVASPSWLACMEACYQANPALGGVGGRDCVYLDGRPIMGRKRSVGIVQPFGRVIGNHHLGVGPAREVDVLKGVNMSFRRATIGETRFDGALWGAGAQSDCELAFCLALRRKGARLLYDPAVVVYHLPAARPDHDPRVAVTIQAQIDRAHNETITLLDHLGVCGRTVFWVWALAVGTLAVPGLLQCLRLPFMKMGKPLRCIPASLRGRWLGARTWRRRRAVLQIMPASRNSASLSALTPKRALKTASVCSPNSGGGSR